MMYPLIRVPCETNIVQVRLEFNSLVFHGTGWRRAYPGIEAVPIIGFDGQGTAGHAERLLEMNVSSGLAMLKEVNWSNLGYIYVRQDWVTDEFSTSGRFGMVLLERAP